MASPLVRITARLCHLLRDANRQSWFAPGVRAQVESLTEDLARESGGNGSLAFRFEPQAVALGDERLDDPPKAVRQLIQMVRRKGYESVTFDAGTSAFEIVVLCQILQTRTARASLEDLQQLENVHLGDQNESDRLQIATHVRPSRRVRAVPEHDGADREVRDLVTEITGAIDGISAAETAEPVATTEANDEGSGLLDLVGQLGKNAEIALVLSSLRRHDEYTYDHSINVGLLSICLARYVGWRGRDLEEFGIAALIHDVGKLYTPLEILNKPGRLTPQEWIVMKRHPKDGHDILVEGGVGSPIAPSIALEHHISEDGTGYPVLPYGPERIHLGSKMVKIADVYDAFTTIRPYRSQSRPQEVLKMLRKQAGTHFHGELVEAFCEMMGEYPIGSTLKLASGRIGLVIDVHRDAPDRPLVRVLRSADGRKTRKLELVDLRATDASTGKAIDEVVEAIDPVIRNIPVGRYV